MLTDWLVRLNLILILPYICNTSLYCIYVGWDEHEVCHYRTPALCGQRFIQDDSKAAGQRHRHDIMVEEGNKELLPAIVLPFCSGLGSISLKLPVAQRPHTLPANTLTLSVLRFSHINVNGAAIVSLAPLVRWLEILCNSEDTFAVNDLSSVNCFLSLIAFLLLFC